MEPRHLINIFMLLGIVIGSCTTSLQSIATNSKPAFRSSIPPTAVHLVNSDRREQVALLLLIDKSASIVGVGDGNEKCDADMPDNHLPHVGALYIATVLSHLPLEYSQNIHVGISQFGDTYSQIIKFAPADTLADIKKLSELAKDFSYTDESTDYAAALREGYQDLNTYSSEKKISKKIILILTDGLEVKRDHTEKVLAEEIPLDVQIRVDLVCPDTKGDKSFWAKHRISTSEFPDEWLADFWQISDLQQALPPKSGWVNGKKEWSVSTNGDVNQVKFEYFSWPDPDHHNFTVNDDDDFSLNTTPDPGCGEHIFSLKSRGTDRGFWWIETKTPKIAGITLSSLPLINDTPVEIDLHLSSRDLNSGEMAKWRDCYKDDDFTFGFVTSDGKQLDEPRLRRANCRDGTGLCPEMGGDGLYGTWIWSPPTLQRPVGINVRAKLMITDSSNNRTEIISKPYIMPVFFKPFRPGRSVIIPKLPDKEWYFFDLNFNFDIKQPNIYLLRTSPRHDSPSENGCSQATQRLPAPYNSRYGHFVQQFSPSETLPQHLDAIAISRWAEGSGSYRLHIERAFIDKCNFDQVVFIWEADPNLHLRESSWEGDLEKLTSEEE